jgi:hypothetical protein
MAAAWHGANAVKVDDFRRYCNQLREPGGAGRGPGPAPPGEKWAIRAREIRPVRPGRQLQE